MTPQYIDYRRLSYLGDRVKSGLASKPEKDEFMSMLYQNGSITSSQYNNYRNNQDVEDIMKAALAVGAVVLIGYLLKEIFSSK